MNKKIGIGIGIFVIILIIAGIIANYVYRKSNIIEIEYQGQTVTVTDIKNIEIIENILLNSKYDGEICNGINTHKITMNNEIYYLKESCQEIQKGDRQAKISKEDLEIINNIISNEISNKKIIKFGLVFYQKTAIRPKQTEKIISKGEIKNIDYNVYAFEGHIAINLNSDSSELTENSISLRDALLQNKITMEEIIEKANEDFPDTVSYDDGGSMEYHYENYTIIKLNRLDGNKDVYIGAKEMTIHDLEINSEKDKEIIT